MQELNVTDQIFNFFKLGPLNIMFTYKKKYWTIIRLELVLFFFDKIKSQDSRSKFWVRASQSPHNVGPQVDLTELYCNLGQWVPAFSTSSSTAI